MTVVQFFAEQLPPKAGGCCRVDMHQKAPHDRLTLLSSPTAPAALLPPASTAPAQRTRPPAGLRSGHARPPCQGVMRSARSTACRQRAASHSNPPSDAVRLAEDEEAELEPEEDDELVTTARRCLEGRVAGGEIGSALCQASQLQPGPARPRRHARPTRVRQHHEPGPRPQWSCAPTPCRCGIGEQGRQQQQT